MKNLTKKRIISFCAIIAVLSTMFVVINSNAGWYGKKKAAELCTLESVTVELAEKEYTFNGGLEPVIVPADVDWFEFFKTMEIVSYTVRESDDCTNCSNQILKAYTLAVDEVQWTDFLEFNKDSEFEINRFGNNNAIADSEYHEIKFALGYSNDNIHDNEATTCIVVRFERNDGTYVESTATPIVVPELTPTADVTIAPTTVPTTTPGITMAPITIPEITIIPTTTPAITPKPTPTQSVVSVKFKKSQVKIKKGKKITLKVKLKGVKKAKFSTNKKKIAKIVKVKAKKVTIKGMKKGKAIITAKAAGKKAKCRVTVRK